VAGSRQVLAGTRDRVAREAALDNAFAAMDIVCAESVRWPPFEGVYLGGLRRGGG
jgi:hypothetical protein